jgi:hypothetical protein
MSPNPPEIDTVYEPALVGFVELAAGYVMMILSPGATTAAPIPSVGGVKVRIRFAVPENAIPQAVRLGAPASVSVVSAPVETPCVNVTVEVALPVKSYDAGKVMMIVDVLAPAPDGVVKRIVCDEVALIVCEVIVSESPVKDAACAGRTGKTVTIVTAITRRRLRGFERVLL